MFTDKLYTGQREMAGLGIYHYGARFYSPKLGRFLSADTVVPGAGNPQAFNRYSYVLNNPLMYIDPSGHHPCRSDYLCKRQAEKRNAAWYAQEVADLKKMIKDEFDWDVQGNNWSLTELQAIYDTGLDIQSYADGVTGGNGNAWMLQYLGNTTFKHASWKDSHAEAWPNLFGGATVSLGGAWLSGGWKPYETLSHELGHVWDINTGFAASYDLNVGLGGAGVCLFCAPGPNVPKWNPAIHRDESNDAYGNSGRNEYFAEAFSQTIYNRAQTPSGVSSHIDGQMTAPYPPVNPLAVTLLPILPPIIPGIP